ncbi:MAG: hypothetical protein J6X50_02425 [Bacilli bacterium]|nr:hypothetical protein [Bacilli bacterium]
MKKKLILLPLLTLCLAGCANMGFGSQNNNNGGGSKAPASSIPVEDIAVKILDSVTFFPDLNDDLDLDDYVDFDPGVNYTLRDYTFTSTNDKVIKIENYHAKCVGEGYAEVNVQGPGLTNGAYLSFFIGSIAGNYAPSEPALKDRITLSLGEPNADRECAVSLVIEEGAKYNYSNVEAYNGTAKYVKDRTPFLNLTFDDAAPRAFTSINAYLSTFGLDAEQFNITTNVYGLMSYDETYGLEIRMMLNDFPVSLYAK